MLHHAGPMTCMKVQTEVCNGGSRLGGTRIEAGLPALHTLSKVLAVSRGRDAHHTLDGILQKSALRVGICADNNEHTEQTGAGWLES